MNKEFSILALPQGRLLGLIALWWGFWLCAARWAYPRFVDTEVIFLVVGSIGCFVGTALLKLWWQQRALNYSNQDVQVVDERWPIWGLVIVMLYQMVIELSAFGVLLSEGASAYRALVYTNADKAFGSWKLIWVYDNFLMAFGLYCIYRWLANGNKQRWWVVTTIAFFVLDTLTRMGRFPLYMMLVCFIFAWLLRLRKIRPFQVLAVATILFILLAIGVVRNGVGNGFEGWERHLSDTVVNYHIYGFGIFARFVQGLDQFNTPGIPFLSAGFLWSPMGLFEPLMKGLGWTDYFSSFNAYIQKHFDLGTHVSPNAFTTLLLPFWLDGGVMWMFTVMAVVGLLFGSSFIQKGSMRPSGLALVIAHLMIFGIFQPILNTQWFYVPLATHFFANAWIRYRHVKH